MLCSYCRHCGTYCEEAKPTCPNCGYKMACHPTSAALEAVTAALEHPQFIWRTIQSIADELGTDIQTVRFVLAWLGRSRPRVLVRSSRTSAAGDTLYTTVKHYKERVPVSQRIAAGIHNRIV